ncbi:ab-hydrolase associated lipase region protein [Acanthamoeba castellanii str. Neff]|uniref:Ab-hydrolase associated lipase region protein n=1 Tax=Acanthamoeba castellanii (strain ATCC 30010 / Neff) TaxID=1257118 RepID=L8GH61_ACACF|nr:ab-hydrolase associated lipase region protein [Acanthamoeba castellanii str. Neff]ELR11531.1 ab-hydrolase associated lipase region protein [Acanthamoeba castellanii str. Neff]
MSPRLVVVAAAILLCCCPFLGQGLAQQQRVPRAGLTTCQLAQLQGYLCAEHWTTTADGFGINIQRIANASGFSKDGRLIPVVLQHGFLDTSATWVLNQAHQSLAFILADSGYDVWLPNSRGNGYSMNSTRFNPGQDAFWAWNFDQMALYDVPATVSYVQYITGRPKGATISIGAFSKLPSLASGISVFVALAPVTYTAHQRIACPTYVFYGTQDYLADPQDVATLTAALRASGNYLGSTSLEGYAHMGS